MPPTVRCPACGKGNGTRSNFCRVCGGRLTARPPSHRRAIDLFRKGDSVAAEKLLRETLAHDPEDPETVRHLGHVLLHAGRRDEAKAAYDDARRLGDESAELRFNRGVILFEQGLMRDAAEEFEAAAKRATTVRKDEFYLGLLFPEEKLFRAEALMDLGSALKELGILPEATARLEEAVALNPGSVFAHGNLGDAYLAAGRFDDCVREYRRVLELAPPGMDLLNVHNDLGIVHYKQGKVEDAIRELKFVVTRNPEYPNAIYNLGLIYAKEGLTGRVMEDYQEFLGSGRAAAIFLEMSRSMLKLGHAQADSERDGGLVGDSPALSGVREDIRRAAVSDSTVLIQGESGVGKELVAR